MTQSVPLKLLQNINECFVLFSRDGSTIPVHLLSKFLHTLGIAPSEAEICDLENELHDGNRTSVSKSFILQVIKQRISGGKKKTSQMDSNSKNGKLELFEHWKIQFKEAFEFCDSNQDEYIDIEDLIHILKRFGENPSIEEVKDMIEEMDFDNDGKVSYKDFLKYMEL